MTRRQMLSGAVACGFLTSARRALAKASQPATPVNFDVPPNACDCHTHIFGDPARFPLYSGRTYTPEPASPDEMLALDRSLHIARVVIVTPSVYGVDNSATLYGIKARGSTARGVAVIDDRTSEADLDSMARAGMRGIRVNLATLGQNDPDVARRRLDDAMARLRKRNWHIQMYTTLPVIASIRDLVMAAPMPFVFDHFGGAQAALGIDQPGFADLIGLLKSGKAYVKLSGAYRASANGPDYPDAAPLARALISANPDRVIWGSDWPHPNTVAGRATSEVSPLLQIDDGRLLNQLAVWAPDAELRRKILVENPARLYGF